MYHNVVLVSIRLFVEVKITIAHATFSRILLREGRERIAVLVAWRNLLADC